MGLLDNINLPAKIIDSVVKKGGELLENRSKRKHEKELTKLNQAAFELQSKAEQAKWAAQQKAADANADISYARAAWANSGWKDELNTIMYWIWLTCGALAATTEEAQQVMDFYKSWPIEMRYTFCALILSSVGIRLRQKW